MHARLHYLTRTDHARQRARDAGLTVTDHTLRTWLQGTRAPSKRNLERIEQAYRTVRRENVARYLLARLNRQGRGTRVEIVPRGMPADRRRKPRTNAGGSAAGAPSAARTRPRPAGRCQSRLRRRASVSIRADITWCTWPVLA